ncbi:iron ABC transporter permease [Sporosarcina sp. P13]|uniref:FecCD family ABC transporter permease n=1 Tax=Sporosarcina sp. P13 TaxID=2048263 RepID=UPI000C167549|nr:iron chelate uptake ABC transporter family permease subunit [Sporosarcina sp. P13]PIC64656.1 iron ABC transporter permease [Sporosarcina sp. P13]
MGKHITFKNKSETYSFQIHSKTIGTVIILGCLSIAILIISLSIGSSFISPWTIIKDLIGVVEPDFILNQLRLPRVLLAFMVGAALGVAGAILQAIIRNPLASPDIIGITAGASAGAIIFIVVFLGTISVAFMPLAAIFGALLVASVIYLLAWNNGVTPIRLVLIGIGVAAAMKAIVMMMIVLSNTAVTTKAYLWLTGSLYGSNWGHVFAMLPFILIFIPLTCILARSVSAKELGDDIAVGLGVKVQSRRFTLLLISVALAGSAAAFAGGIEFVGLIAPHIGRMLIGRSFAALIPVSALIGGMIVVLADLVARTAFLPLDIPAGVFTAAIGAPFFIYLLFRNRNI